MMDKRSRSGSVGSFAVEGSKTKKKTEKRKRKERESSVDGIVASQFVTLNEFDNLSYQLLDSLVHLLDKKEVKAIELWAEKATELHKSANPDMKGKELVDFVSNIFHSYFRCTLRSLHPTLMDKLKSAILSWEQLFSSEKLPEILKAFQTFFNIRTLDRHNSLIGCKPSKMVLENLLEYNPVGKIDSLISVDELPRSILKLKNDQSDLGSIAEQSVILSKQAICLNQKSLKSPRISVGEFVVSQVPRSSSEIEGSPVGDHYVYSRVVKVEKNTFYVTTDPYQMTTTKASTLEKFPATLLPSFELATSYSRFVDDGFDDIMNKISNVVDRNVEKTLRENTQFGLLFDSIFDICSLTLKCPLLDVGKLNASTMSSMVAALRSMTSDSEGGTPPIQLSLSLSSSSSSSSSLMSKTSLTPPDWSKVVNEGIDAALKVFEPSKTFLPHLEISRSRLDQLRSQAVFIAKLRIQQIENVVHRIYLGFTFQSYSVLLEEQLEEKFEETLSETSVSSSMMSSTESEGDEFGDDGDCSIVRSMDSVKRRGTTIVGSLQKGKLALSQSTGIRRPTANGAGEVTKWLETTTPSAGAVQKPKAGSVRVQIQRKRILLGNLIEEKSTLCTRLAKLDIMKSLPQDFIADKKKENRVKMKSISFIFGTLGNILSLEVELLKKLRDCIAKWPNQSIGSVLRQFYVPYFRLYPSYVNTFHFSILSFVHLMKSNKVIHNFVKKHADSGVTKAEDFLVELMKLPSAHLPSFSGFLQKVSNDTLEEDDDYQDIQTWHSKLVDLSKLVAHRDANAESFVPLFDLSKKISGFPGKFLKPDRKFLKEGNLTMEFSIPEKGTFQEHHYYYLFSDCIVACQLEGKTKKDRIVYVVRHVPLVAIHNINPHDDRGEKSNTFTLELRGYCTQTFSAPSAAEKKDWVEKLWRAWEEVAQTKVFEVDLLELMTRQQALSQAASPESVLSENDMEIPKIMLECLQYLYSKGINKRSISVLESPIEPTFHSKIQFWKERYDRGKSVDLLAGEKEVTVVIGLLKTWLGELPEPLIPWSYYESLVALEVEGKALNAKIEALKEILHGIPLENKLVISHILCLCEDVFQISPSSTICSALAHYILRSESGAENKEKESQIFFILVKNIADIFPAKADGKLEPSKHLDVEVGSLLAANRQPLGSRNRSISAYTMVP